MACPIRHVLLSCLRTSTAADEDCKRCAYHTQSNANQPLQLHVEYQHLTVCSKVCCAAEAGCWYCMPCNCMGKPKVGMRLLSCLHKSSFTFHADPTGRMSMIWFAACSPCHEWILAESGLVPHRAYIHTFKRLSKPLAVHD
jgi:hypothetical protein